MRRFVVGSLAVIGGLSVLAFLAVVAIVVVALRMGPVAPELPGTIVLNVDLSRDLAEGPGDDPLTRILFGAKTNLRDVLDAIERAGDDTRVKGLYAHLGDDALGLAKTQEVRDAISAFRAKGKFAIAFAETFGEFGPGTRPYYLATAFDQIWLQPMGGVGLTGLYTEVPFLRGTLDRLGIAADFERRSEYKTVMNSFTEDAMPAPQREAIEALLTSLDGQIVRDIAAARKFSEAELRGLIDRGPFFADEAREARLVDRTGYRDEAIGEARRQAGSAAELVALSRYLDAAGRPHQSGTEIALIYGTGMITREGGAVNPLGAGGGLNARKVAAAFRQAVGDSEVRAILFRIDSPGGSAVGSETVWREVMRARRQGKPVIVSMGDLAGSGGYYIAAPADKIVAQPATLTGSIGVIAGKLVLTGLLRKLGVTIDTAQRGANAAMFSVAREFSPESRLRLENALDRIYRGFKAHVADGRQMTPEAVEAIAKGRVWSGEEAKENGLVDAVGGYAVALRLAREAAKIPEDAPVKLVVFPREKGAAAELYERLFGAERDAVTAGTIGGRVTALLGLFERLDSVFVDAGVLRMPPLGEVR